MEPTEGDGYRLSTGKTLHANCHIIGIDPKINQISEGFDGMFYDPEEPLWNECKELLTKEECSEIADYAIGLWTKWKEKYGKNN